LVNQLLTHPSSKWYLALILSVIVDLVASAFLRAQLNRAEEWTGFLKAFALAMPLYAISILLVAYLLWKSPTFTAAALLWAVGVVVGSVVAGLLLGDGEAIGWQRLAIGGFGALLVLAALPAE
jgi:hypothetical protein